MGINLLSLVLNKLIQSGGSLTPEAKRVWNYGTRVVRRCKRWRTVTGTQVSCDSTVKHHSREQSQTSLLPAVLFQKRPLLFHSQALAITVCTRVESMPRGLQVGVRTRPFAFRSAPSPGIILIRYVISPSSLEQVSLHIFHFLEGTRKSPGTETMDTWMEKPSPKREEILPQPQQRGQAGHQETPSTWLIQLSVTLL